MKCAKRIVSLVLTIFLFMGSFSVLANAATDLKTGIAFVSANSLRLRSKASSSASTLTYASRDEVVVLLGKTGSWYKVIYNLQVGYMHGSYLKTATAEDAELGYGAIVGDGVNVRSGPGTGYASIDSADYNEKAYIIGINNKWFKVIFGEKIGYIRSDYVKLTEIPYENKASKNKPLFFVGGKSTGVKPSAAALRGETASADDIIATAKKYMGVPYLWGGVTPSGFDCSGYVQYVFNRHGISLPRTSSQQAKAGTAVSKSKLKAGDLVFFATGSGGVSHVGIYLGNNQFIHASTSKGVTISNLTSDYWASRYYSGRRVL